MASRKSPSQRDPMTRMSQAVRAGSPASMGGRVANATPVQTPGTPNRRVVGGGDNEHNGTGADSTVVGTSAVASGDGSAAYGDFAEASALNAIALGTGARATAISATAVSDADATGASSLAVGKLAKSEGYESVALGFAPTATGDDSVAIGANAQTDGGGSLAVGSGAYVSADRGIAVGYNATSDADAIAIGDRAEGGAGGNVVLGPIARATSTAATTGGCVIAGAGATSSAARTVAIGNAAHVTHADTGKIKVDTLEVESSSAAGAQTSVILTDSAGTRWQIGVDTSGNPIGLGAA